MSDTAWTPTAPPPWSDANSDPLADIQAFAERALWNPPYKPDDLIPEWMARRYPELLDDYQTYAAPEPTPAPPHPWEAALEARRNRNTGPTRRPRAPKKNY